jgi:NitT/TauT family transport system substrate-binding protein
VAAAAKPPASAAASQPAQPVKIQVPSKGAAMMWLYAAKDLGFFAQNGVDAEIVPMNPNTAVAAIQAGEVDFMAAIGSAHRAALRGLPLRVILVAGARPDFLLVAAKGITDISQLKGKTVAAYAPQNSVNSVLVELFRQKGLDESSYSIVNAGDNGGRSALLFNGQVSATLLDATFALTAQKQGYPIIARASDAVEAPSSGIATSTVTLQQRRDLALRVLRSVSEGLRAAREDKQRVVDMMVKEYDLAPADAEFVYTQMQPDWSKDGRPTPAAIKFDFEADQRDMGLPELPRAEQVYDLSLLDQVAPK